jgi:hypothetical protein
MTREVVYYQAEIHRGSGYFRFFSDKTSIKPCVTLFESISIPGSICIILSRHGIRDETYNYVVNRNVLALTHSLAPVGIILDAILDAEDNEWHASKLLPSDIPLARQCIESIAMMNLMEMDGYDP